MDFKHPKEYNQCHELPHCKHVNHRIDRHYFGLVGPILLRHDRAQRNQTGIHFGLYARRAFADRGWIFKRPDQARCDEPFFDVRSVFCFG